MRGAMPYAFLTDCTLGPLLMANEYPQASMSSLHALRSATNLPQLARLLKLNGGITIPLRGCTKKAATVAGKKNF